MSEDTSSDRAGKTAPDADQPAGTSDQNHAAQDDDLHRRFREALARKNAHHESHPGSGNRREGVGDAHNDKRRRQFRRKSG